MQWYGCKNLNKNKLIFNHKKFINYKNKKNLLFFKNNLNMNFNYFTFYYPSNWNILFFKNNKIQIKSIFYIYTPFYYFFFPCPKTFYQLYINKYTQTISFIFFYKNNYFNSFLNKFKIVFNSFSKLFFKKLKFKGKGYYIYKNFRNTIALQFGYSHIKRLYFFFSFVKFLSKTSILIFGINVKNINKISYSLYNTKTINIFTGKGMRFTRQIIYKKTGKISSYR